MKYLPLLFISSFFVMTSVHAAPDAGRSTNFNQYCNGKAINANIDTKVGDRTIKGTCQLGFKPTNPNSLERGAMRDPALQKACIGKPKGAATSVKLNGKTIAGTCDIIFKSDMRR